MTPPPLSSISISGLTSIRSLSLDLTSDVTVLVGPNGAGKSNVVSALELLGRIVDGQVQEHVLRHGGISRLLHRAAPGENGLERIALTVWGDQHGALTNGYRVELEPGTDDQVVLNESILLHDRARYPEPYEADLGFGKESRLRSIAESTDARPAGIARHVLPFVEGCRVFHFHDTSADAPVKRLTDEADNLTLAPDARNLAPLLYRLQLDSKSSYDRIVRAVQSVAPFFDDFVLRPERNRLRLRWREKSMDNVFSADGLSDGTLRFISLATLLLQPDRPGTVVLDEPELGLHPFAIHQLASMLRTAAADGRRVVLATQSVTLLSQFAPEEIAVVSRSPHGTRVERLDIDALSVWLDEYSLGELWEKNLLGGRPRPDGAAPPNEALLG